MINFAVQVKTIETTGAGRKHTSNITMDATSFDDAIAIKTAMTRTNSNVINRECIVCVAIQTRDKRVFIPIDDVSEVISGLEKCLDDMTAKPGPAKPILAR